MNKSIIKHSLLEEPFTIPMKIRKKLPIDKTIFELNESEIKKFARRQIPMRQQSELVDPLLMDSALIKSLLFGKMESYLIFISITISSLVIYMYEDYNYEESPNRDDLGKTSLNSIYQKASQNQITSFGQNIEVIYHLLLLETFISLLLLIIMLFGIYFQFQTNKTRGIQNEPLHKFIKFTIFLLHPNPWMAQINYLLHLFLIMRLPFMYSYWIKTTIYHNNRSFRLTQIYGIKPSQNFMFAIKSIVDEMTIREVFLIYASMALVFSHCLFLAGLNQQKVKPFWSCFQIVIVTLPTIGYGEYSVANTLQRGIILIAVVIGACLNSLITLIMLKQFQMSTQQTFSYNLLHKLDLKQSMEDLSRQYIIETIKEMRQTNFSNNEPSPQRRQIDNNFKQHYKYLKARYTQINTRDLNSMFNLFKEQLKEFKIKCQQMNNLIFVLVAKLHKLSYQKTKE